MAITPGDGNGATAHGDTTSVFNTVPCTALHPSTPRRFAFRPTDLLTHDQGMWVTNLYNGLAFLFSGPLNRELCISKKNFFAYCGRCVHIWICLVAARPMEPVPRAPQKLQNCCCIGWLVTLEFFFKIRFF